ncbi:MAG: protein kinase [Myxococcota bacterium]
MNAPYIPKRAEAGVVIGGYELIRRIGRGGMAEVWVARRALGAKGSKFVAIKLIADHYVGDERYTRMFRAEAELAAVLSHANIVQVFDEGEDDGRSYLIMEWVDGLNLLKLGAVLALLDDDDRRFRVTSYIMGQLLYALSYAHSITSFDGSPMGVVHRDVSPQNVLISNHGEVKLTDFGVAYHAMEESSGIHVKGKVRYMSPEQLSGKTRSPTVDLYAVGALLHELLDGKKFRGEYEDGQEMFTAVLSGVIPPLTRPAPPELDELRLQLLQPDPADRVQSAEDAIEWLKRFPGHGDARTDLTKLCGSLTGVVRPRAGPGRSSQVPMAERRTTQFKGNKGLAKPKVNVSGGAGRKPGPPPPPPPRPAAAKAGAGIKTPSRQPGEAPVISGQTEFVEPQSLPIAASKRVVGAGSPSHAAGAEAARAAVMPASPQPVSPAVSQPVSPVPMHGAVPTPSAVPGYVAAQASSQIAVHGSAQAVSPGVNAVAMPVGAPAPGVAPGSMPGAMPGSVPVPAPAPAPAPANGAPPRTPPTEILSRSEISDSAVRPNATEVVDATMFAELRAGTGTDQEIVPQGMLPEGSDTTRDIQPRPVAKPGVSKGVAVAGVVMGLLMVAVMSTTLTWWLFNRHKGGDQAEAEVAAAVDEGGEAPAASEPGEGDEPEESSAAAVADAQQGGAGEDGEPGDEPGGAQEPEAEAEPQNAEDQAGAEQPAEVEAGSEAGAGGEDEAAVSPDAAAQTADAAAGDGAQEQPAVEEPEPSPPKAKPTKAAAPKAAAPKATVYVNAFPGMNGSQVRIGSTVITVPKSNKARKKLSAGRKKVSWRPNTSSAWKQVGSVNLRPGGEVTYFLSKARGLVER